MMLFSLLALTLPVLGLSQSLIGLKDPKAEWVWNDRGTTGQDFQVWQPVLPGQEWKMVGQRAQPNYAGLAQPIYRFREQTPGQYLVRPEGFQFIWDDRGSIARNDGSAWRATCPVGTVAVGDFFLRANKITVPQPLFAKAACVKIELVEHCEGFGDRIWIDKGTWSKYDLSVWSVKAKSTQVGGFFYVNNNHDSPPGIRPFCLKKSSFIDLW